MNRDFLQMSVEINWKSIGQWPVVNLAVLISRCCVTSQLLINVSTKVWGVLIEKHRNSIFLSVSIGSWLQNPPYKVDGQKNLRFLLTARAVSHLKRKYLSSTGKIQNWKWPKIIASCHWCIQLSGQKWWKCLIFN